MGRHSSSRRLRKPRTEHIERLEPASTSAETPAELTRRRQRAEFGERQRRGMRRRRTAIGCAGAFGVFLLVAVLAVFAYWRSIDARLDDGVMSDAKAVTALETETPVKKGDPFYMVIMGVDNREGETRARSDTLIVAYVDPLRNKVTLISIPRDTRVKIPEHGTNKINAANALGGPALVIETVKELTGLPISHYLEVDFMGFKDIVDALGGITVNVPQKIQDPKAGNYDYTAYTLYAGEQKLNGAQSLTFVRSRQFPEGDLQRIRNQQLFIRALLKETLKVANALKLPKIVSAVADNVSTDMSVTELLRLANDMRDMTDSGLEAVTMPGAPKTIGGVSYVVADDEAFAAMVERVRSGQPAAAPETSEDVVPTTVSVTVRNGAGIDGVATDAARSIRGAGFSVEDIGNTNQFAYTQTLVIYKTTEHKAEAEAVLAMLKTGKLVASRGMYAFATDVLVIVGEDWGRPTPVRTNQIPIY
ncbi:MAG: hypothetical protein CVT69_02005 [Actinobacteria bacterium HGW-Actinobacteria-9]|jgi:LCP family protein required for cell wall assembly|nr:MAG: hypothetical protein CVT69_02005 [Actinobacteria bacterium HGW-Actinobacteria-9]